ncbi:hypothetical protein [Sphingomonas sp.]|uniref:hypothetical protein n=1 Tax=Sphingomonas sp. TaxID=28214 RepID=UPI003F72E118
MTPEDKVDRVERLIDSFERDLLAASDEEISAMDGTDAAGVVARALQARGYDAQGLRPVSRRPRVRTPTIGTRRAARPPMDARMARASYSSRSDEPGGDTGRDDGDE